VPEIIKEHHISLENDPFDSLGASLFQSYDPTSRSLRASHLKRYGKLKMNGHYPVKWKQKFKGLTVYMTIVISVPILFFMAYHYISEGFDYEKTFEQLSLPGFLILVFIGVPLFSAIFAFLISQYSRIADITISDRKITGRNYWMLKKTIPLSDITRLTKFSSNGINAIVVHSKYHGKVYISEDTERLNELLGLLEPYLTNEEKT